MAEIITLEKFSKILSGKNKDGEPNCRVRFMRGSETDPVDCGEAEMEGRWHGQFFEIGLKFTKNMNMARAFSRIEDYLKFLNDETGYPDENHTMYIVLSENVQYWSRYIIALNPVLAAFCAKKPGEMADTLRLVYTESAIMCISPETAGEGGTDDYATVPESSDTEELG